MENHKDKYEVGYFLAGTERNADMLASAEITDSIYDGFEDGFRGTGCFKGIFLLQFKEVAKPYQATPKSVTYILQEPFNGELDIS